MRKTILMMFIMALCTTLSAKSKVFSVTVANTLGIERRDMPVVIDIEDELSDDIQVATALVTCNGTEIPCQLDDFDQDGEYDELIFLADLKGKEKKVYSITISEEGVPRLPEAAASYGIPVEPLPLSLAQHVDFGEYV